MEGLKERNGAVARGEGVRRKAQGSEWPGRCQLDEALRHYEFPFKGDVDQICVGMGDCFHSSGEAPRAESSGKDGTLYILCVSKLLRPV